MAGKYRFELIKKLNVFTSYCILENVSIFLVMFVENIVEIINQTKYLQSINDHSVILLRTGNIWV